MDIEGEGPKRDFSNPQRTRQKPRPTDRKSLFASKKVRWEQKQRESMRDPARTRKAPDPFKPDIKGVN